MYWFDPNGLDIQNNSSDGVWVAGEGGERYYLAPGDTYYGPQDGVYTADGVFKTNDGVHATVNPDGSISTFGAPIPSPLDSPAQAAKAGAAQAAQAIGETA